MKLKTKILGSVLVIVFLLGVYGFVSMSSPERKIKKAQVLLKAAEICDKLKMDKLSSEFNQQALALSLSAMKEMVDNIAAETAAMVANQSTNATNVP